MNAGDGRASPRRWRNVWTVGLFSVARELLSWARRLFMLTRETKIAARKAC
jgi:hypothetical protein